MRVIGKYTGGAVNDDIICLDHATEGEAFTSQDFPQGFICDYCGKAVK
jgi:hypothetical protein